MQTYIKLHANLRFKDITIAIIIYLLNTNKLSGYQLTVPFCLTRMLHLIGSNHGYNTLVKCCSKVCGGLSSNPLNIAQSLVGKGFIGANVMKEVRTLPGTSLDIREQNYTQLY